MRAEGADGTRNTEMDQTAEWASSEYSSSLAPCSSKPFPIPLIEHVRGKHTGWELCFLQHTCPCILLSMLLNRDFTQEWAGSVPVVSLSLAQLAPSRPAGPTSSHSPSSSPTTLIMQLNAAVWVPAAAYYQTTQLYDVYRILHTLSLSHTSLWSSQFAIPPRAHLFCCALPASLIPFALWCSLSVSLSLFLSFSNVLRHTQSLSDLCLLCLTLNY